MFSIFLIVWVLNDWMFPASFVVWVFDLLWLPVALVFWVLDKGCLPDSIFFIVPITGLYLTVIRNELWNVIISRRLSVFWVANELNINPVVRLFGIRVFDFLRW